MSITCRCKAEGFDKSPAIQIKKTRFLSYFLVLLKLHSKYAIKYLYNRSLLWLDPGLIAMLLGTAVSLSARQNHTSTGSLLNGCN